MDISRVSSRICTNYKDQSKKEAQERKRNILHLIWKYLHDSNLAKSAEIIENEAQLNCQYEVCDNIDLEVILQEYQSYYSVKFQKEPKILRRITRNEEKPMKIKSKSASNQKITSKTDTNSKEPKNPTFDFEIIPITTNSKTQASRVEQDDAILCEFDDYSSDWRELADLIIKQIVPKSLGITWDDCIGLEDTAELIKEATVYPLQYPELFKNVSNWNGVLLYGPPGTGKTLLAKALASESDVTVLNVTSSTFISKWRGESEKLIKTLFDVARLYNRCVIFIDEIDSLMSCHSDGQHEASKRFQSEFLTQIDGLYRCDHVFLLATTNHPWILNRALLRRFEKRILVKLPTDQSRRMIFNHYLGAHMFSKEDLERFSNLTVNYSGADIKIICKEVEMAMIREKISRIKSSNNRTAGDRKIEANDVIKAIKSSKSTVDDHDYKKFVDWASKYGSNCL